MHLSFTQIDLSGIRRGDDDMFKIDDDADLDCLFFHSVPTSFFVMDERIPRILRELVTEAEGSLKMNFLTGASACTRKAIYELLVEEGATGTDYETRIKSLKGKYPGVDPSLFDDLAAIQDMTSDKVHEHSWDKWDSPHLRFILATLKAIFHEIYVIPREREDRSRGIRQMREQLQRDKKPRAGSE
jgi:hypothetical protein